MCNTGCFYERRAGGCKGRPTGRLTILPHCMEPEDMGAYNESVDDAKILACDLDRCDRQDHYDNLREERRISNR